jgi:hypothetical protein
VPNRQHQEEDGCGSVKKYPAMKPKMELYLDIDAALIIAQLLHAVNYGMERSGILQPGQSDKIV